MLWLKALFTPLPGDVEQGVVYIMNVHAAKGLEFHTAGSTPSTGCSPT